jgi:Flp pilus assembly protein TadG
MMPFVSLIRRDCRGSAAVELALVMPLLLVILFGSVELGNYFMNQHTLVKAVRDGARFAARQSFTNYTGCSGDVPTPGSAGSANENTKLIVRKGTLDGTAPDLLPNWSTATFSATVTCIASVNGQPMLGIYRSRFGSTCNGAAANGCAQVVTVRARMDYLPVLRVFGFNGIGLHLNAASQAAVAGI